MFDSGRIIESGLMLQRFLWIFGAEVPNKGQHSNKLIYINNDINNYKSADRLGWLSGLSSTGFEGWSTSSSVGMAEIFT